MSDYIRRKDALTALSGLLKDIKENPIGEGAGLVLRYADGIWQGEKACAIEAILRIQELPAADVKPVVRGEWIKQEPYNQNYWKCSNCGETDKYAYRDGDVTIYELQDFFCPNCGADMRGENSNDKDSL